ncbi:hypothetical protein SISSUDRAFT_1037246 [Sistotremastrum suecicum HHB10207 ss-3]|uniref:Uncharacterized protein n=1 Tax=Sistotremastrum suecicum HHB10207 ss-3 TaxID=1314776 RepID=A0A165YDW4_9AGAM|nr:hypothetical protein SISSUDRAFT_1037246 [Sistotremastrum suecicum HHB10207 ss-3]
MYRRMTRAQQIKAQTGAGSSRENPFIILDSEDETSESEYDGSRTIEFKTYSIGLRSFSDLIEYACNGQTCPLELNAEVTEIISQRIYRSLKQLTDDPAGLLDRFEQLKVTFTGRQVRSILDQGYALDTSEKVLALPFDLLCPKENLHSLRSHLTSSREGWVEDYDDLREDGFDYLDRRNHTSYHFQYIRTIPHPKISTRSIIQTLNVAYFGHVKSNSPSLQFSRCCGIHLCTVFFPSNPDSSLWKDLAMKPPKIPGFQSCIGHFGHSDFRLSAPLQCDEIRIAAGWIKN